MGQLLGRTLLPAIDGDDIQVGEWAPLPDHRGRLTGHLAIGLADKAEALNLAKLIKNRHAIQVDGEAKALHIHSVHIDAEFLEGVWGAASA